MPRFVILEHDHPVLHWDLMLEKGEVLQTWRLAKPPEKGLLIAAEKSFDHRLFYLDYEGPVSQDRGSVKRWDSGSYQQVEQNSFVQWEFFGERLTGIGILHANGEKFTFEWIG